ncbi:MAG: metallophosphoesterase [Parvularcula sp.]
MLIAQLTDLHIGTGGDIGAEDNYARLLMVFDRLARMKRQPDLIIGTGDLTETGSVPAYKLLKRMLDRADIDMLPVMGNHDISSNFKRVFGRMHFNNGFCQYSTDLGPVQLVVTDTHDETIHGGDFCPDRAEWLRKALTDAGDKPVLLAMHHPPFVSGIDWMGARDNHEPWVDAIRNVVKDFPNVKKIITGHIHRQIERSFAGTCCFVSSATAAEVDLELAPITSSEADGRPLIVDEPPGFALHWWDGQEFVSYHVLAGDFDVILEYHERFRDVMKDVFHVPE